jgi:hypothetical protein
MSKNEAKKEPEVPKKDKKNAGRLKPADYYD